MMRSNSRFRFLRRAQELEDILLDPLTVSLFRSRVPSRRRQTLRACFHRGHVRRAGPRAGEGERALAREAIEHPTSLGA